MAHDDDLEHWREPRPHRPARWIVRGLVAALLLVCVGGTCLRWGARPGEDLVIGADPVVLTAGAAAGLLLLGWGLAVAGRAFVRLWGWAVGAETVSALVVAKRWYYDHEGGYTWRVRVTGRTRAGDTFARTVPAGHREPPDEGQRVDVRYHAPTRHIDLIGARRGPLAAAVWPLLRILVTTGLILYLMAAIVVGLVHLWS